MRLVKTEEKKECASMRERREKKEGKSQRERESTKGVC